MAQFGLARLSGGQEVAGSNPAVPTRRSSDRLVAETLSLARGKALAPGTGQVRDARKRNVIYEEIRLFPILNRDGAPTLTAQSLGACG